MPELPSAHREAVTEPSSSRKQFNLRDSYHSYKKEKEKLSEVISHRLDLRAQFSTQAYV